MSKRTVFILLGLVLVVGVGGGYAVARLTGPPAAGQVRNASLEVGDEAPDFRLVDHTGRTISLSDFRGASNVVIAFYPLAWTPV